MKKILISVIITNWISVSTFSQTNLAPNYSFEEKIDNADRCGLFIGGCNPSGCNNLRTGAGCCCCNLHLLSNDRASPTNLDFDMPFVKDWNTVFNHQSTPDYFNTCAPESNPGGTGCPLCVSVHIPDNWVGSQLAHSGNAYSGILARHTGVSFCGGLYSEYIKVQLKSALISGVHYAAKMYVSLADNSNYACAGLSMLFTSSEVNGGGTNCIITGLTPQVTDNIVISDKNNWIKIEGDFYATGGENFLTIGVFDANLSSPISVSGGSMTVAYYYIDDVFVLPFGDNCCPDHIVYNNTNSLPEETGVKNYITASSIGPVTVQNGQNVTFHANNSIELLPGFSTQPGATFVAQIQACNNIDLPYPASIIGIDGGYTGCPGSHNFLMETKGADNYRFQVFDPQNAGHEEFDSDQHSHPPITSNITAIWDGYLNTYQYNWPWFQKSFFYILRLFDACGGNYNADGSISVDFVGTKTSCKKGYENSSDSTKNSASTSTGINNLANKSNRLLYISPNPNSGAFTVAMDLEIRNGEIQIRDLLGNLVKSLKTSASSIEIDLVTQPKGVYFVKIISEQGEVLGVKKVVVQ